MNESIKQIGQRLRGLREVLGIPAEEVAELCETPLEQYLRMEAGEVDPSVYRLARISKRYGIALDVLLFGEEPRMSRYFLTRSGQGLSVERRQEYTYQSLASGFRGRKIEPFMTTVEPLPDGRKHSRNSHDGQEFDMVISGRLELTIGDKVMELAPGDSIYFDATQPHSMNAIGDEPVKFLVVII